VAFFLNFDTEGHNPISDMRILLVDDDSLMRWSLQQTFATRGHEVTQASCGNTALSLLQTRSFDIILTDMQLPDGDGFKVVKAARAISPNIPVIMMSSLGAADLEKKDPGHVVTFFLDKPIDMNYVTNLVESFPGVRGI